MQTAWTGSAQAHPSGAISVKGDTDKGRTLQIFIHPDSVRRLRKTFLFADKHGQSLGHSQWHVDNQVPAGCETCK